MSALSTRGGARQVTLDVSLLGRDYKIACDESERAELDEAVAMLDRRMREIRAAGKTGGAERIAVMAALNLAHDLLRARRDRTDATTADATTADAPRDEPSTFAIDDGGARRRIAVMRASIEEVLGGQDKLF